MISYSVGYSAIGAAGTTVTVAPPPLYAPGDFLVMAVIGGGTAGAVSASAPSGWTALPGSGTPGVFHKTATPSEPASYTVTLASTACAAVLVAAYPAATTVSTAFAASGADVTSYSPPFPSGVTSGQTVLLVAAAVAAAGDVNGNAGAQNVNLPSGSGWTTEVPVFGPALPDNPSSVYPCAIGLAGITGSASSPTLTSPQGCGIYAAYVVLNVTGTAPPAPYTVTATATGPAAATGVALTVKAVSGAATAQYIFGNGAYGRAYPAGPSQAPSVQVTPAASGSYVYGAVTENFGVTGGTSFTADSNTTFSQNIPDAVTSCIYGTFRGTSTTAAGTPVTLGASAPASGYYTAAAAEVLAAPGHTLAETATVTASALVPGDFATTALALPAYLASQPAYGTLLVAMVSANSYWGNGPAAVTVSDTLGLTWYPAAQVQYPSYSGVWLATVSPQALAPFAQPGRAAAGRRSARRGTALGSPGAVRAAVAPPPGDAVLDEGGYGLLDEASAYVLDESVAPAVPSRQAGRLVAGKPSARRGAPHGSPGAPYVYVPVIPAVFRQPNRAVTGRPSARKGTAAALNPGAPYVYVPVIPAPFTQPNRAAAGRASARRGTWQGSPGAPQAGHGAPAHAVLDEGGYGLLDEAGAYILDETGVIPSTTGLWSAARAGLPGDSSATNWASQASQFLTSHGLVPVYQGARIWEVAAVSAGVSGAFSWLGPAGTGWLPAYDVDQPFQLALGSATAGRVQVPVLASGNGADLQVLLCADNGSGRPVTGTPLASVTIPASHVTAASATGSLASAGPLATARGNASLVGAYSTGPWAQPAVSANGTGSYATPVTSGNFTALIGGYDGTAALATGYVAVIAYQGGSVSGGMTQPALPQPAFYTCAAITADSVVVAGGKSTTASFATVWTAPWTPGTGTVGAWSSQQALPSANVYGAMAAWGTRVYVIGGSPDATAAHATSAVWTASAQSGQVTAWTACPPLPQPLMQAYAAVVGNWLIVAGGTSTAGAAVTSTWYSAINGDGSLAGWQQGPQLPQAAAAFGPGWNLAVTDSAVIIVSGYSGGVTFSQYTQVLPVSPDGVSDAWQVQAWTGSTVGAFQAAAYPSGPSGQWQLFNLHLASFDVAPLGPVPLVSVPLPATGLTPGHVYHVVMRQLGGSLSDSLQLGVMQSSGTGWLHAPRGSDASWTPTSGQQVAMNVYDGSAAGNALHLVQDSGAGLVTLVRAGASQLLTGVMESASFPTESPEAVLGTVTQVTWAGGLPSGLVTLA